MFSNLDVWLACGGCKVLWIILKKKKKSSVLYLWNKMSGCYFLPWWLDCEWFFSPSKQKVKSWPWVGQKLCFVNQKNPINWFQKSVVNSSQCCGVWRSCVQQTVTFTSIGLHLVTLADYVTLMMAFYEKRCISIN